LSVVGNYQGKDGELGAECGDMEGRVRAHHVGSYDHFCWHSASFTAVIQMCPKAGLWTLCQGVGVGFGQGLAVTE